MLGERVAVLRRDAGGEDEMGEPIYRWKSETVPGCLVRPLDGDEVDGGEGLFRPDGVTVSYRIAFPKAWTRTAAPLRGCRVALVERGMDPDDEFSALRVSGAPDRTIPCPTLWDMTAEVGRVDG